jgi:ribosome maturation factor RimP
MAAAAAQIESLVAPAVSACGCELWGIEYLSQGRFTTLRVYIDHAKGIGVEQCAEVSRQVAAVLDVEDPIVGEYTLEVSSPGLDRPLFSLAHYQASVGEKLSLKLRLAFDGRRRFTGLLRGIEGDEVILQVDDEEYLLPFDSIEKANIVPRF